MRRKSRALSRAERRQAAAKVRPAAAVEGAYVAALRRVFRHAASDVLAIVAPALVQDASSKLPPDAAERAALAAVKDRARAAGPAFDRMARSVENRTVAALQALGVRAPTSVAVQVSAAREANLLLVENAGRAYAASVREVLGDPENFGLRVEELRAKLLAKGDIAASRAELIARDQTLKLTGAITKARQTSAGITSYTWNTSNDDRVRESHAELDGQVFRWDTPPSVGHPGEDFQCRCVALPIIDELADI